MLGSGQGFSTCSIFTKLGLMLIPLCFKQTEQEKKLHKSLSMIRQSCSAKADFSFEALQ